MNSDISPVGYGAAPANPTSVQGSFGSRFVGRVKKNVSEAWQNNSSQLALIQKVAQVGVQVYRGATLTDAIIDVAISTIKNVITSAAVKTTLDISPSTIRKTVNMCLNVHNLVHMVGSVGNFIGSHTNKTSK